MLPVAVVAALAVVVAGGWFALNRDSGRDAPGVSEGYTVGPSGGTVGPDGGPKVTVPIGALTEDTEVTVLQDSAEAPPPRDLIVEYALEVGTPVDINFGDLDEVPGALVQLPVDPALLPQVEGAPVAPELVFMATFSEELGTWLPLESTYDPTTGLLTAEAPHFSWFNTWVVDPVSDIGRSVGRAAVTGGQAVLDGGRYVLEDAPIGVQAMWDAAASAARATSGAVGRAFGVLVQEADCSSASPDWTVTTSLPEVSGCVVVNPDGSGVLRMTNRAWLAYVADTPDRFGLGLTQYDLGSSTATLLSRLLHAPFGTNILPARGATESSLTAETMASLAADGRNIDVGLRPDYEGLLIDAALVALVLYPPARLEVTRVAGVITTTSTRVFEYAAVTVRTRSEILLEVTRQVRTAGGAAAGMQAISGAVDCVSALSTRITEDDNQETYDSLAKSAAECALDAIKTASRVTGVAFKNDVMNALAVLPDTAKALVSTAQNLAFLALGKVFQNVTVAPPAPEPPPAPAAFSDPLGLLVCGAFDGYAVACETRGQSTCPAGTVAVMSIDLTGGFFDPCGPAQFAGVASTTQVSGATFDFPTNDGDMATCEVLTDGVDCHIPGGQGFRYTTDGTLVYEQGVLTDRD